MTTNSIPKEEDRKQTVKLTLKKMRVVAKWKYTAENSECSLCHRDLMLPVQEAFTNKLNGDVTIGTCQHGFHAVCIDSWITQGHNNCPQCQVVWETTKNVGSSVYVYKTPT